MSDEREKPIAIEIVIRKGFLETTISRISTFLGDPDDTRESQYAEGQRVLTFLREGIDVWAAEIETAYGPKLPEGGLE